jgi:hypothetical protein
MSFLDIQAYNKLVKLVTWDCFKFRELEARISFLNMNERKSQEAEKRGLPVPPTLNVFQGTTTSMSIENQPCLCCSLMSRMNGRIESHRDRAQKRNRKWLRKRRNSKSMPKN